jgi:hypothetical protein
MEGRTFETLNAGLEVGRLITKPSQIGGAITHLAVLQFDGEDKLMKAGGEEKRYLVGVVDAVVLLILRWEGVLGSPGWTLLLDEGIEMRWRERFAAPCGRYAGHL